MQKWLPFVFFVLMIFIRCTHDEKGTSFQQEKKNSQTHPSTSRVNSSSKLFSQHPFPAKFKPEVKKTRKKRRHKAPVEPETQGGINHGGITDSLFISRLMQLRNADIELDLNEPLSKKYLFGSGGKSSFESMITLSRERFFKINFDNDILDNTDQFYTNGIRFDLISPTIRYFPLSFLMAPYWNSGINYYGISITQNMYTPSTTKKGGILYGDRPYAAYLALSAFKITNDARHKTRAISELMTGVVGPSSQGGLVQKAFHNSVPTNNEPLGWEYQIADDLVLNYNYSLEKGIVTLQNIDVNVNASGSAGTLYDNLYGGILFRAGWFNPYFSNLGISRKFRNMESSSRNFQAWFYGEGEGKLVGYDATLQGGVFNRSSVYLISNKDVSRIMFSGTFGVAIVFGGIKFEAEQLVISPEFHHGWWHKWVHLGFTFAL